MENHDQPSGEESVQIRLPGPLIDRVRKDANGRKESVRKFIESALWRAQGVSAPVSVKRYGSTWKIIDADDKPLDPEEFTYNDKNEALRQAGAINSAIADSPGEVTGG